MDLSLLDGGWEGVGLIHAFLVELNEVIGQLSTHRYTSDRRYVAFAPCAHAVKNKITILSPKHDG